MQTFKELTFILSILFAVGNAKRYSRFLFAFFLTSPVLPKHVPAHAEFWEGRCFRVETPVRMKIRLWRSPEAEFISRCCPATNN